MSTLRRALGTIEVCGVSLSMMGPTMAIAFTTTLAAQAAGRAVPLAFLIGAVSIALVGLSFVSFGRRVAHAGSVYAYIGQVFGPRTGFIAGWALLLTYTTYMAGATALFGNFATAGLAHAGVEIPRLWMFAGAAATLTAIGFAWKDTRIALRLMLLLEGISVLAILLLAVLILSQVPLSSAPLTPDAEHGWSGVGYGTVFAILCFAGFEGAATLGEEALDPKRAIPLAMMGTVAIAGLFYVLVSYAVVMGYGVDQVAALAQADSPLDELSLKYISGGFATFIDFAAATSALACTIGSLSAAARLLYALGRAGLSSALGTAHPQHRTPTHAILAVSATGLAGLVFWGSQVDAASYAGSLATIGTLMLIIVYIGVTAAALVEALRNRRRASCVVGLLGTALLIWPLWNSVYPVPDWPGSLWPYLVAAWLIAGAFLVRISPSLARIEAEATEAAE
ncbi:MAG: APC family permease [Aliidongia sp.]